MKKLNRADLYSLEEYSEKREGFRANIREHKKNRILKVGEHITLHFEDYSTMRYQVQEILRVERVYTAEGIEDELDAYNPLIPDGSNWKATFMIEYADESERKVALTKLLGIEDKVWVQVEGCEKVYAIADEDLDRSTDSKTSAVHFLRFELQENMRNLVIQGANISVGVSHPEYTFAVDGLDKMMRDSLAQDLQ